MTRSTAAADAWPSGVGAVAAAGLGSALALLLHRAMPPLGPRGEAAVLLLLLLPSAAAVGVLFLSDEARRRWGARLPLASALLFGLALRLQQFLAVRGRELDPDAQTYMFQAKAHGLGRFWEGTTWTPVWVYMVRIWFALFGSTEAVQRSLTVVVSLAGIAATYAAARRLFGPPAAAIAAYLTALSPMLAHSSARGLREETVMLELLTFLWLLLRKEHDPRTGAVLGGLLGLIGLTRMELLPPVGAVLLASWLRPSRPVLLRLGVAVLAAAVLVVPQAAAVRFEYGEASHWAKIFTRSYVNIEYETGNLSEEAWRRSSDGSAPLPTREEIHRNFVAGPLLSPFDWYFRVHAPGETLRRTLAGTVFLPLSSGRWAIWGPGSTLASIPQRDLPPYQAATTAVSVIAVAGLAWALVRRRPEALLLLLAGSAVYAFPSTIGGLPFPRDPTGLDLRLTQFLVPFLSLGLGGSVQLGAELLRRRGQAEVGGTGEPGGPGEELASAASRHRES